MNINTVEQSASTCSNCRTKGNCCRGFALSFEVPKGNWYNASIKKLQEYNLDFMHPIRPLDYYGSDDVQVQFDCSYLGEDGLCTNYENRPELCKAYKPKQDALCCEYVYELKGIPIILKEV